MIKKTKQHPTKMPVLFALAIFGLLASATFVAAYSGLGGGDKISEEDRKALQNAVKYNDYETWKSLMASQLTEERFNRMSEKYKLFSERRAAVEAAFEAEDYDAWVTAVTSSGKQPGVLQYINEENFPTLVELHEARQAGDIEQAKILLEELGFPHVSNEEARAYRMGYKNGRQFANKI